MARRVSMSARADIDVRVATMPTQHGESAVIRLLPRDRGLLDIARLGFSSSDEIKLRRALDLPHGMIVITGPTGSGKTTTLATMLCALNQPHRQNPDFEDPIEYEIPGVNQSQVQPAIGLTFAAAMRAFVRQDPDVIMVGEVRDAETASIAVHAALDRPSRADDAAHRDRGRGRAAPHRSRRRGVPAEIDAARWLSRNGSCASCANAAGSAAN